MLLLISFLAISNWEREFRTWTGNYYKNIY